MDLPRSHEVSPRCDSLHPTVGALLVRDDNIMPAKGTSARKSASTTATTTEAGSRLTSADRVAYPDSGITKGEIAAYYEGVAAWLLPELVKRPLSLLRCPEGTDGSCFFQKHHAQSLGKGVHAIELREVEGSDQYLYVRDIRGVLDLVQMNTIEFHPWGVRIDDTERPDRIVFDLDPGDDVAWSEVKAAARDVHDRLAEIGLESWVRLSGGKGVHVVVPIRRGPGWDEVKDFSEAFAEVMAEHAPQRYIAKASKQARKGRIFIDWLRNARGATSVTNWSLRARAGAPVVMPLSWAELGRTRSAADYRSAQGAAPCAHARERPVGGFPESGSAPAARMMANWKDG